ncbi:hypothetical protein ACP70R_011590 [Stipagrostis hirtigluma subsp. patula]
MSARLVSLPLLLVLTVLVAGAHAAVASSVEETCEKACSGKHTDLEPSVGFCVSSLQAAPGSDSADARGLAAIAANLTLANYTAAGATVKALEQRGGWPAPVREALATCHQRYFEMIGVVHDAIDALATKREEDYIWDMVIVRAAPILCGTQMMAANESSMEKVTNDTFNIASVAMLVVRKALA